MLSKCANPDCSASFHYLGQGKLYEIRPETAPAGPQLVAPKKAAGRAERFWLCNECASVMTLAVDPSRNIVLMPLTPPKVKQAIAS